MRGSCHQWGVVLASGLLTLTGCGITSSADSAAPGAAPPGPPGSEQPAPPARPFVLPLQDVSSCDLLSGPQRTRLGFDEDPLPASYGVAGSERSCSYSDTSSTQRARIGLVTDRGVSTPPDPRLRVTTTGEAGFPAVVVRDPDLNRSCDVEVDVAPGQHLDVLYTESGRATPPPQDDLCRAGRRVAGAALATLTNPGSTADPPHEDPGTWQLKTEAVSPRLAGHPTR